ncbi:MAG: hypothetical protein HUK09_02325 [Bacteroidaceae bacterium]|nr:hypothetical protein [Bacteroidaceae bacterium]
MANQYFVLGIGGTGMRCIESLIHLCAMGMFDNTELHLLALDTDKNNGNFSRLKEVKEAYVNAKSVDKTKRTPLSQTFFSADLRYYEFSPNYEVKSTFAEVFNYDDTRHRSRQEADLADLVLTKDVETFNLRHGYRAQTHLGSMMMYHSIIEAARSQVDSDLKSYLQELIKATQGGKPRVFILGSVFGGTGASSIPIIPQALSEAAGIMSQGVGNILSGAYFSSTLLTAYFSFNAPSTEEINHQKVIATSDKFALNSQAAMMFYDDDTTVRTTYQRFYMLGTDGLGWDPMAREREKIKTVITGGGEQKNDSHYIELLAACAAMDFYYADESKLKESKTEGKPEYVYRAIEPSGRLSFVDFVGSKDKLDKEFAKKFGMLVVFGILCNGSSDFVETVRGGHHKEIKGFDSIDVNQVDALKKYFRLFHLGQHAQDTERLEEAWLGQLHRSAGGGDRFLFHPSLFGVQSAKELRKFSWNKQLYGEESVGKDWTFKTGLFGSAFDSFKTQFIKQLASSQSTASNAGEQFYKVIYDTLCVLYNIN